MPPAGARETVAKALALECMRAAREQERNCYVFAFSGPQEVRELELNMDMKSVNNLMDFLEKVRRRGRASSIALDSLWALFLRQPSIPLVNLIFHLPAPICVFICQHICPTECDVNVFV